MDHLLAPMTADGTPQRAAKAAAAERSPADPHRPPIEVDGEHRAWARVFRRRDRLLLGLAPLRSDLATTPGQVQAIVLVPPVADANELVADVVADPAAPRRAPTHDQIRTAITAGRRAARLTRLGDPRANAAWTECADRWRALGDDQRANLALRHGQRAFDNGKVPAPRRGPQPDRLLADELTT
jgi:hypothetical protein